MYQVKIPPHEFINIFKVAKYNRAMKDLGIPETSVWDKHRVSKNYSKSSQQLAATAVYIINFSKNNPSEKYPVNLKKAPISKTMIEEVLVEDLNISLEEFILKLKSYESLNSYSIPMLYVLVRTIYEELEDGFYITGRGVFPTNIVHVTFKF